MLGYSNTDSLEPICSFLSIYDITSLSESNKYNNKSIKHFWVIFQKRWFPMSTLTEYSDIHFNTLLDAYYMDEADLAETNWVSIAKNEIVKFRLQNRNKFIKSIKNFRLNQLCSTEYITNKRQILEINSFVNKDFKALSSEQHKLLDRYKYIKYENFIVLE
jgi:hypothetical protein